MPYTVGLLAPNGNVGSATLRYLTVAHKDGKIKLVILHRPSGPPKNLDKDVSPPIEVRAIDLSGEAAQIEEAVKGLNILVSAVSGEALASQSALVGPLSKLENFITVIPAAYGAVKYSPEDAALPQVKGFLDLIGSFAAQAREAGLGVTTVDSGIFDLFFFVYKFVAADLKANQVRANAKQLKNGIPITSIDYLAAAITTLVSRPDAESIANKSFSAVEIKPTGQELVDLFTKINGKPAEVIDYTPEIHHDLLHGGTNFGPVVAGYSKNWEEDSWELPDEIKVEGRKRETLAEIAARFHNA